jgi:energy-coupling factor transport system permease protein
MSPEIKIITYVLFITSLFFIRDVNVYLLVCVPFFVFFIKIPRKALKSGWMPISLLLAFTFFSNMFYQQGRVLFSSGGLIITEEGIHAAVIRTMRVFFMIAGAKILLAFTKSELLIGALRNICKPLARLKVPVDDFFQVMELTLKSLPALKQQTACMYKDHMNRERSKGYLAKVRTVSSLLIPMFVKTIQSPEQYFRKKSEDEIVKTDREDAYDKKA